MCLVKNIFIFIILVFFYPKVVTLTESYQKVFFISVRQKTTLKDVKEMGALTKIEDRAY
jgi:hypothetical protein